VKVPQTALLSVFLLSINFLPAQPAEIENSQCLIFVDYDFIWTIELVVERNQITPIFNAICLHRGQWELEPAEIRLFHGQEEFKVTDFSIDSGDASNPYVTKYLGIKGPDSVGVDLVGNFQKLDALSEVVIELGKDRFILDALDCKDYDAKMDKIAELDMDGGNMIDDFEALGIKLFGRREAR
jgi:hypothetical protein